MLLAVGSSFEWIRFFQVMSWIVFPVLFSAIFLTILFHYRKKKKKLSDLEDDFVLASPEQFVHSKEDGEFVFFDHSHLILEYKKRMFYNHAKFISLQKDYAALKTRFSSYHNMNDGKAIKIHKKNLHMENLREQTSPDEIAGIPGDVNVSEERTELLKKIEKLDKYSQRLQEENRFLQEQISLQTAGDDERDAIINRWKTENKMLREKVAEKEYLQDLLEEKTAQIMFLQAQTEQRIKNQYQADQKRIEAISELERLQESYQQSVQQVDILKNELIQKDDEAAKIHSLLCAKEESLSLMQQQMTSAADRVTYLESVLQEIKTQNDLLQAEILDSRDLAITLKDQLDRQQLKVNHLEKKQFSNKQLLKRLHDEICSSVEADEEESPVIELKSVYTNSNEPVAS